MGRVIRSSSGPHPFPDVPERSPLRPPQPGEELLKYDLEVGACCELTPGGWCCFAALSCTPLACLPFFVDRCHQVYQRPVYGYAMDPSAFLAITAAAPRAPGSPAPAAACSTAPPTIVCVADADASQAGAGGGGGGNGGLSSAGGSSCCVPVPVDHLLDKPPVPPCSIFIPPSAVPPSGFPSGSPLPRYPSPLPPNRAGSTGSPADSPRASAYLANPPSTLSSPSVGQASTLLYASPTARWQQQQTSLQEAYLQKMQQQQRELQEMSSPRTAPSPSRFTSDQQQQAAAAAAAAPGGADAAEGAPAAAAPVGGLPPPAFASSKLAAVRTLAAVDQQRKEDLD